MERQDRIKVAEKSTPQTSHGVTISSLLKRYNITSNDTDRMRELISPIVMESISDMIDDFYVWLKKQPEFNKFFGDNQELVNTVRRKQELYWIDLLTSTIDTTFVRKRILLAETHERIGLPIDSYYAALSFFLNWITNKVNNTFLDDKKSEKKTSKQEILKCLATFVKVCQIDQALVVNHYVKTSQQRLDDLISRQADTIHKLATPVSILAEGILLVSIVGILDSKRSQEVLETTLTKIVATTAKVALIDISGVDLVDTAVANYLIKMTQAIQLIGSTCILSGISPAIAQTVVELGIDLKNIKTKAVLKDAVEEAYKIASESKKVG